MKIVLASRNRHKIAEIQTILREYISDIEILSLDDIGFEGEITENGKSFEENARIKASLPAEFGYTGLGDDSGLCVHALGGAPGIYSARFAGDHGNDAANNRLLLEKLADKSDRSAEFVCAVCCVFPDGREIAVRGTAEGRILEREAGSGGFGYDPLFFLDYSGTLSDWPVLLSTTGACGQSRNCV